MHLMVSMCASLNPAVSGPWGLSPLPRPLRAGLWAHPRTQQGHYTQAGPLGLQSFSTFLVSWTSALLRMFINAERKTHRIIK